MKMVIAILTAGVMFAGAASAAEEKKDPVDNFFSNIGTFSADVAITTDYAFRGISQTNEGPALQGGFGWSKGFESSRRGAPAGRPFSMPRAQAPSSR